MKAYLFDTKRDTGILRQTPFNYRYIFARTAEGLGKNPSKYVYCDFIKSNRYLVQPFHKPISTTLPSNTNEIL